MPQVQRVDGLEYEKGTLGSRKGSGTNLVIIGKDAGETEMRPPGHVSGDQLLAGIRVSVSRDHVPV